MVEHWLLSLTVMPIVLALGMMGIKRQLRVPPFVDLFLFVCLFALALYLIEDQQVQYHPGYKALLLGLGAAHFALFSLVVTYFGKRLPKGKLLFCLGLETVLFAGYAGWLTEGILSAGTSYGLTAIELMNYVLLLLVLSSYCWSTLKSAN